MSVILTLGRLRQEDSEFDAKLCYIIKDPSSKQATRYVMCLLVLGRVLFLVKVMGAVPYLFP